MSFGRATGAGWHETRKLVLRNLSSRPLRLRITADERDKGGARGLVFAFAPPRMRIRPGGIARVYVAVRSLAPAGRPVEGMFTVRPRGSAPIRVPWLVTFRPKRDALLGSVRLSTASFKPSDNAPAVLSFQAGRIAAGGRSPLSSSSSSSFSTQRASHSASSHSCATSCQGATRSA